jgi:hypothetical protein
MSLACQGLQEGSTLMAFLRDELRQARECGPWQVELGHPAPVGLGHGWPSLAEVERLDILSGIVDDVIAPRCAKTRQPPRPASVLGIRLGTLRAGYTLDIDSSAINSPWLLAPRP